MAAAFAFRPTSNGAASGGCFAVVAVADDGRGMAPGTVARIFDPFFTTKADGRGTGLGLSISQTVANQAGGFITVESTPAAGTTFRVFLPTARPKPAPAAASRPASTSAPPGAKRILVVEDVAALGSFVARCLGEAGYDALHVTDRANAARVLDSEPIDLLLTDLSLSDGSGAVLARSACAVDPKLRVIVMSGSGDFPEGFERTLAKPFDEASLLAAVESAFAS